VSKPVRITQRAQDDIDAIASYIALDNLDAALRLYEAIDAVAGLLGSHPELGVRRDFQRSGKLRVVRVPGFEQLLVYYRPSDSFVDVLRVIHGARDQERALDVTKSPDS
tara:strand:+ start:879 stop:1205 length:327 start_codon:yes stop_codon:yes gene_type:complete